MQYVYPAIFRQDKILADTWSIEFPDVEGAATCGYSLYEALEMAEDALVGILCAWEDYKAGLSKTPMKNRIVDPTSIEKVIAEPDEFSTSAFVTLIKVDTDDYRKFMAEFPQKNEVIPQEWRDEFNKADEKFLARKITLADFQRIVHDLYVKYDGAKYLNRPRYGTDDDEDEINSVADEENIHDENIAVHS